jgi:hypothetical protein
MLLSRIMDNCKWLEQKAKQNRCVDISKINAMRGSLYGLGIAVRALKDKELDDLTKEIEKIKEHIGLDRKVNMKI